MFLFFTEGFVFSKSQRREGVARDGQRVEAGAGGEGRQAAVPLSMLRQRLEGIWSSASTNERLSEVGKTRGETRWEWCWWCLVLMLMLVIALVVLAAAMVVVVVVMVLVLLVSVLVLALVVVLVLMLVVVLAVVMLLVLLLLAVLLLILLMPSWYAVFYCRSCLSLLRVVLLMF